MSTEMIHSIDGDGEGGSRGRHVHKPDLIITSVLLVVFVAAFLMATGWRDLAAYFPLGVSGVGVVASASLLLRVLFFPPKPAAPKTNVPEAAKSVAEQEYEFFKNLSTRDWVTSLGWLGGFFVALSVFGIYLAMVAFTVGYLRFQTAKSWWFAAIYAALLGGVIYVVFAIALKLPLPGGLLGLA
ncbi:tripartite tricarboxylate transporter TctB family protein [Pseudarthrobacter sp. H3Y2-7]|uniref:tripartite tricarboxylate transporter TctB family protein n=1 Tax=Pseudarthrobacter naphthalenicus TaxID=3031328 RepID=UPI0023AEF666|nr:tripartite tricarboxylate transporter TctB family protein [Pseudarthrobacter sp. H3Y2-7]MDE8670500.1 tripartite tricarboxylate transporter TctB family protein [Pseudarthrobacter sp. H3Y2-7]